MFLSGVLTRKAFDSTRLWCASFLMPSLVVDQCLILYSIGCELFLFLVSNIPRKRPLAHRKKTHSIAAAATSANNSPIKPHRVGWWFRLSALLARICFARFSRINGNQFTPCMRVESETRAYGSHTHPPTRQSKRAALHFLIIFGPRTRFRWSHFSQRRKLAVGIGFPGVRIFP